MNLALQLGITPGVAGPAKDLRVSKIVKVMSGDAAEKYVMAAYVLVNVDTSNPVEYEEYKAMAQDAVARFGGRYLARGGKMKVLEGDWAPKRLVVLVFDSFERATEWWESDLYAPAKRLRQRLSKTDIIVVDGYEE